jgi:hypothetical protein
VTARKLLEIAGNLRRGRSASALAALNIALGELAPELCKVGAEEAAVPMLRLALAAQTRGDLILLADMLEYELAPLLDSSLGMPPQ